MGRYYHGDINGKFWFGVQSSIDATNFGGEMEALYAWSCCGMQEDLTEKDLGKLNECPRECYLDDDNTRTCEVITDENYVRFRFEKEDLEFVEHALRNLVDILGVSNTILNTVMNLEDSKKKEDSDEDPEEDLSEYCEKGAEIIYAEYEKDPNRRKEEIDELWARLYLGIKIYLCLKKSGSCCFDAEL